MSATPSLDELTFEADPRREWTPPQPEAKLWDAPHLVGLSPTATGYRTSFPKPNTAHAQGEHRHRDHVGAHSRSAPGTLTAHKPSELAPTSPHGTPRRASPIRVVCPEPSLSQLPTNELPSVRGQMLASSLGQAGSPNQPNPTSAPASGTSGAIAMMEHLSNLSRGSMNHSPDPVDSYLARFQLHQRLRDTFRSRQEDHMRAVQELETRMKTMMQQAALARSAKSPDSPGKQQQLNQAQQQQQQQQQTTGDSGGYDSPGASPAPSSPSRLSPAPGVSQSARSLISRMAPTPLPTGPPSPSAAQRPSSWSRCSTPVPNQPTIRNRFLPLSATAGTGHRDSTGSGDSPPRSASALASRMLARTSSSGGGGGVNGGSGGGAGGGAAALVPDPAVLTSLSPAQLTRMLAEQAQRANQGAYLALPDGSFAGSPPMRAVPTAEGLLFEPHSRRLGKAELPDLQLRYLRPTTLAPREPRALKKMPRQPPPPSRALPNGIPASRLERLSARRRRRSPSRLYPPQPAPHQSELVLLNGSPLSPPPTVPGLTACGEGLLRSPSLVLRPATSPTPDSSSPTGGPHSPSRSPGRRRVGRAISAPNTEPGGASSALAQFLSVSTAPNTGEPLLDDNFYAVLSQHFRSSLHAQTAALRSSLNMNLPLVLGALNCVNVTEDVAGARLEGGGSVGGGGGFRSTIGSPSGSTGGAATVFAAVAASPHRGITR